MSPGSLGSNRFLSERDETCIPTIGCGRRAGIFASSSYACLDVIIEHSFEVKTLNFRSQ
jgi:hypothetical protein